MASTLKPASASTKPDMSHHRPQGSASQLTAELKAARAKAMLAFEPSTTSSAIDSLASSRTAANLNLLSSTWPAHSSSQFKQKNPHAIHRSMSTNSSHNYNRNHHHLHLHHHHNNKNNTTNGNFDSLQTCSEESALDVEIRRSYDDDQTLRACSLWERFKTANTAYRQTFSREPSDDEFWKQVSSSYHVW